MMGYGTKFMFFDVGGILVRRYDRDEGDIKLSQWHGDHWDSYTDWPSFLRAQGSPSNWIANENKVRMRMMTESIQAGLPLSEDEVRARMFETRGA